MLIWFAEVLQVLALEVPLSSSVNRVKAGLPLQLQPLFSMNSVCTLELKAENVCLLYSMLLQHEQQVARFKWGKRNNKSIKI